MKILFAPQNTASFLSNLMEGLKKVPGVQVSGLSLQQNKFWTFFSEWTVLEPEVPWRKQPLKRLRQVVRRHYAMLRLILWADVIHWIWDIKGQTVLDVHYWLIWLLRKPVIIEWVGSELRMPEYLSSFNHYYKQVWDSGEWEYRFESDEGSRQRQRRFRRLNALPAVVPEMSLFIDPAIFKRFCMLYVRVELSQYKISYPDIMREVPVLVHTPTAIAAKGTKYLRRIIESLKEKGLRFEYIEITNSTREAALEAIGKADIFLDHFIYGSYGMASCEAMAMGKPVFSYIMPEVWALLPADCPINPASLDTLEEELARYIRDARLRHEMGRQCRAFAEQYQNADTIAAQMALLYRALLEKNTEQTERLTMRTLPMRR